MMARLWWQLTICLAVGLAATESALAEEDRQLWRRMEELYRRRAASETADSKPEDKAGTRADPLLLRSQIRNLRGGDVRPVDPAVIPPDYFKRTAAAPTAVPAPDDYFNGRLTDEPPDRNLGIGSEVPAGQDPAEAMAACLPPWCYPAKCSGGPKNCPTPSPQTPLECPSGTEAKLRPDGSGLYYCVAIPRPCVPACRNGGVCTQSRCVCPVGFTGEYCESVNVAQCRLLTGRLCNYGCRRVGNVYRCLCPPWIVAPPGGGSEDNDASCVPVDTSGGGSDSGSGATDEPCRSDCLNGGVCRGGVCVCRPGWRGDNCGRDVDECADDWLNRCMYQCANTIGSFRCICPPGYQLSKLDGTSCELLSCPAGCGPPGGTCRDGKCICEPGWRGQDCQTDVDECDNANGGCDGSCENTPGSYRCLCPPGQRLTSDGRSCAPADRCEPACRPDTGACLNGSCVCRPGWWGPGCRRDADECALGFHNCRHGCENTPGSYRCLCPPGQRLATDGRTCLCPAGSRPAPEDPARCEPENPSIRGCIEVVRPCRNGGTCDEAGRCLCRPGFYGDLCHKTQPTTPTTPTLPLTTMPPPSTRPDDGICSPACVNGGRCVRGGFCVCPPGFEGDACQERFSCASRADCGHGWCGSDGRCVCLLGWRGQRCNLDINECQISPGPCEHACYNRPGSYRCACDPGYEQGPNGTCTWTGDPACPDGCRNGGRCLGEGRCRCPAGFSGGLCLADVNECRLGRRVHGCEFACVNTRGSWECRCPPGYTRLLDRRTCRMAPPDTRCRLPCRNGGVCRNGICSCQRGFEGPACDRDIDECRLYRPCQYECVNTVGSYTCRCPAGLLLRFDGVRCITPEEARGRPDLLYRGTGVKGPPANATNTAAGP